MLQRSFCIILTLKCLSRSQYISRLTQGKTPKLGWWNVKGSVCAVQNWTRRISTPRRQVCKCLGECQCLKKVSISKETNVFYRSLGLAGEWKKQKIVMISLKIYLLWEKNTEVQQSELEEYVWQADMAKNTPYKSKSRFKNNAASFEENAPELKQLAFTGQTCTTCPATPDSFQTQQRYINTHFYISLVSPGRTVLDHLVPTGVGTILEESSQVPCQPSSLWEWRKMQQNANFLLRPRVRVETRNCSRLFKGLYSKMKISICISGCKNETREK